MEGARPALNNTHSRRGLKVTIDILNSCTPTFLVKYRCGADMTRSEGKGRRRGGEGEGRGQGGDREGKGRGGEGKGKGRGGERKGKGKRR